MLMMHGLCFYGLHGIHLNLKRLVVFIDIHFPIHVDFMLDHTMLLCGVICVILLPIMLAHVFLCLLCSFRFIFTFSSVHVVWGGWVFWVRCEFWHALEGCRDLFVHEGSSSLSYENVLPNPLEHAHVSIVSSPPSSYSPNMRLMSPLIIRRFVSLMWMWAIRIACLICLVGM